MDARRQRPDRDAAFKSVRLLRQAAALTEIRRCLGCDNWFRSTSSAHRICNPCKGEVGGQAMAFVGGRLAGSTRASHW